MVKLVEDTLSPTKPALKGRPKGSRNKVREPEHVSFRENARDGEKGPEHNSARKRTRSRNSMLSSNPFDLPLHEIPEGLTYEWKRFSTVGDEDHFYLSEMRRQGWEPVHPSVHPNWVPKGYDKPNIIRGGLILMERPEELTKEARDEAKALTRQRMTEAEQRLGLTPQGELTRSHQELNNRVVKEWGRTVPVQEH